MCGASVKHSHTDSLSVIVPRSFNYLEKETVMMTFYDPDRGLLTCKCRLFAHENISPQMQSLRCEVLQRISQNQRRMDLKIPLDVTVYVHLLGRGGSETPADIVNISAGGVYLRSTMRAGVGDYLLFFFSETGESIPLTAEVLRVESVNAQAEPPVYGYGCKFVELNLRHEEQLRNFVFQRDREQHKTR